MTGVGVAESVALWSSSVRLRSRVVRQTTLPESRSSASVTSFPSSIAVTKMRFPAITGEERPKGTSALQLSFLPGPNSTGKPVDADTPDPFGPRKRDQSPAASGRVTTDDNRRQTPMKSVGTRKQAPSLVGMTLLLVRGHTSLHYSNSPASTSSMKSISPWK